MLRHVLLVTSRAACFALHISALSRSATAPAGSRLPVGPALRVDRNCHRWLYGGVGRHYSWYTAGVMSGAMASRRSQPTFGHNERLQANER